MSNISNLGDAYNWSVAKIAEAFGLNRGTVKKRLLDANTPIANIVRGNPVYALRDIGPILFGADPDVNTNNLQDPTLMPPKERKDWYQSENERIKLETTLKQLVPVADVHLEMAVLVIRRVETVIATETHALAQKVEQLDAQYGDMNSSINSLQKVVADNQKSQAEVNELIKSEIGDNKAAIEKRAETSVDHNGNASSIFGIKNAVEVNGQYYEAQMMMSASVKNGRVTTQIGFSADTFGIFNPSSGKLEPAFVVVNGQVVMSDAFINKATIEKIIVGTDMRSKNYAAGKTGTRIDMNNGTIEINGSDDSGSRMTIKNDQIAVYAGGKPKIVIGRLYGI